MTKALPPITTYCGHRYLLSTDLADAAGVPHAAILAALMDRTARPAYRDLEPDILKVRYRDAVVPAYRLSHTLVCAISDLFPDDYALALRLAMHRPRRPKPRAAAAPATAAASDPVRDFAAALAALIRANLAAA